MERKTRDMKSPLFFYVYKKKVDVKLRGEISSVWKEFVPCMMNLKCEEKS